MNGRGSWSAETGIVGQKRLVQATKSSKARLISRARSAEYVRSFVEADSLALQRPLPGPVAFALREELPGSDPAVTFVGGVPPLGEPAKDFFNKVPHAEEDPQSQKA